MGKKNIDKLFQEKLKDFSESPGENVWNSIGVSLNEKKKKRRIIPIWWKLGGVAALLAIALYVINPFQDTEGIAPVLTDIEKTDDKNSYEENQQKNVLENSTITNDEAIVKTGNEIKSSKVNEDNLSSSSEKNTQAVSKENKKERQKKDLFKLSKKDVSAIKQLTTIQKQENSSDTRKTDVISSNEAVGVLNNSQRNTIASANNAEQSPSDKIVVESSEEGDKNIMIKPNEEGIAQVEDEEQKIIEEGANKKSIFDEIEAQKKEEEEVLAENTNKGKWSAGASVAPVFFNSIGEGSPVHSIFVANSKSGDVNLSYGLSISYKINKKLSIRSGLHKVDYGYDTNDIEFSSVLNNSAEAQIDNINYTATAKNLVVVSKVNRPIEFSNEKNLSIADAPLDVSAKSVAQDGTLAQQFGYLEVPVELNYTLIDNRFGINLIGGMSSLFLVDNSITVSTGDLTTEVGKANNINNVNFSTNVGLGVNYKVTPKIQFNIEPIFKYQLNTFSNVDGSFNPFSIGIYSGLSFKF